MGSKRHRRWVAPSVKYLLPSFAVMLFGFQNCGTGFDVANLSSVTSGSLGVGSGGGGGGGGSQKVCSTASPAGQALVRKLNRNELNNALKDLLGVTGDYTSALSPDASDLNGFTNNAENLQIDSDYVYSLMGLTEKAIAEALNKTGSSFLACTNNAQNAACARTKLLEIGKKAFRRPLTTNEENLLMEVFNKGQTEALSFRDSLAYSMQRIFMSPQFLYRSSFSGGATAKGMKLSQHELATRLAFFLWNSPPDTALLTAADNNQLGTEANIKTQIKRMIADDKADRFVRNFTDEWIGMQKLQAASREGLTDQLKVDMQEETSLLMRAIIREDRSALDVVNADFTFVNANLASLYGITGVTGTNFRRIDFASTGVVRKGILTQPSILTITSSPAETKPVARGAQILNGITCNPPPPFPDGLTVTPLADGGAGGLSLKERMEKHRQVGSSCYACHKEMDPVGMGLESYDQIGRYRTKYPSGNVVDSSGTMRNANFQNGMEMIDFIVQQNDFKRCITKKLMTYAIGRKMTDADQCAVESIGDNYVVQKRPFSDLILAIVLSDQFQFNQTTSRGE